MLDNGWRLGFCAGIWARHRSARKLSEEEVETDVFGFLTTQLNAQVVAVRPKAMPVILTTADELDQWMTAPVPETIRLQRVLPDGALRTVARGEKADPAP